MKIIGVILFCLWCSITFGQDFTLLNTQASINAGPATLNTEYVSSGSYEKLINKELKNGKLILTFKRHDACFAATYPACSGHDKMWKEVYGIKDGEIVLEKTIEAKYKTKKVEIEQSELEFEKE